jgi:hypothetical protein
MIERHEAVRKVIDTVSANTEIIEVEFYRENGKAFFRYNAKSRGEAPVTVAKISAGTMESPSIIRSETSRLASILANSLNKEDLWEGFSVGVSLIDSPKPSVMDSRHYKRTMVLSHYLSETEPIM